MKMFLLVVSILVLVVVVRPYSWQDYKAEFGKSYAVSEDSVHQAAFNASMIEIARVNALNLGYQLGPTRWTDKASQEISKIVKVSVSPSPVNTSVQVKMSLANLKVSSAASVDWRATGKVSSVKDQGSCGCCWAVSTTSVIESLFLINNNTDISVSPEYLLECTQNSSCDGGYVDNAMQVAINTGIPSLKRYPYTSAKFTGNNPSTPGICTVDPTFYKLPNDVGTSQYQNVSAPNMMSLIERSPFVSLISADPGFMNYKSGIYACNSTTTLGDINHAVTVIGYDNKGNYLIKNSWGTTWGDQGYGWVKGSANSNCGLNLVVYTLTSNKYTQSPSDSSNPRTLGLGLVLVIALGLIAI